MAFREKTAWITLACTLLAYGGYFYVYLHTMADRQSFNPIGTLFAAVFVYVVLQVILMIVASATAPRDANAPADEREHQIQVSARAGAFYVLQMAALAAVASGHVFQKWVVVNAMFAALILAELARNLFIIVAYRRGG